MFNFYDKLSDQHKGLVLLVVGLLLLLNTLGLSWLNAIIAVGAVYLIIAGIIKVQAYKKLKELISKQNKH